MIILFKCFAAVNVRCIKPEALKTCGLFQDKDNLIIFEGAHRKLCYRKLPPKNRLFEMNTFIIAF